MKLTHLFTITLPAALTLAATTHAASITWGTPTGILGDTDVSVNGDLVAAFNIGGPSSGGPPPTTINGVTFLPWTLIGGTGNVRTQGNFTFTGANLLGGFNGNTSANAPFADLSANYRALLGTIGTQSSNTNTLYPTLNLAMNGLTVGETYEFEWWFCAPSIAANPVTATAGNAVSLLARQPDINGAVGQYAIGTFVADAGTQNIVFSGTAPIGVVALNGFQLRSVAPVPEPGTTLFGLALLGFAATRRRF